MSAPTAAQMVEYYTNAIARKVNPDQGDGYQKIGDSGGPDLTSFSLEALEAGLAKWEQRAQAATATGTRTTGSIQFSTITNKSVGVVDCDE